MTQTERLVDTIIEGMQEKKGYDIVSADMRGIDAAPAEFFVICSAGSPQQVDAVTDSVEETARKKAGEKPAAVAGRDNLQWVAMDYGTVMVHVFLPQAREHYDLENLWEYRELHEVPNLD
ncbi:MAG: ribosome silencing factor [Alloprevotella sp.]|nr:ribosome silencing factor [Alloprevotella sp.]